MEDAISPSTTHSVPSIDNLSRMTEMNLQIDVNQILPLTTWNEVVARGLKARYLHLSKKKPI
jgi:hypothetical protein